VGSPPCADLQPIIAEVAGQDILVTAAERYSVLRRFSPRFLGRSASSRTCRKTRCWLRSWSSWRSARRASHSDAGRQRNVASGTMAAGLGALCDDNVSAVGKNSARPRQAMHLGNYQRTPGLDPREWCGIAKRQHDRGR
jgi:hypothetical protein